MIDKDQVYSVQIAGTTDQIYKKFAIDVLYGMIEGDCNSAAKYFRKYCERSGIKLPESIIVSQRDRIVGTSWVGRIEFRVVTLDGEFWVYRDRFDEKEIDKLHPDFESDNWFYESGKEESYRRCKRLYEQHQINWKGK